MFYDRFISLCNKKGVSPSRAALDAGISKSLVTKWKSNDTVSPSPYVIRKLAAYFSITVSELLEEAETPRLPAETSKRPISEEDIKFVLFGNDGEITDAMYEELKQFVAYVNPHTTEVACFQRTAMPCIPVLDGWNAFPMYGSELSN